MYQSRTIESDVHWIDIDGIKIYTISATNKPINISMFNKRLATVKSQSEINWRETAAFAIYHDGDNYKYLVLVWWGNDNELFTSVSVKIKHKWVIDPKQYSFCLYDMEVMWRERNIYIETMDCEVPSLIGYRVSR
ncbi:hypothetical protein GNP73_06080 [Aliivibrio fischeri]|uniref:hypothetical protein n=1 Tax=Aliivibrio fischeri TaxID=668 RepID=UPI0012DA678A|nr:hypothetical protein [Aliivibrio fischeri]MUJ27542.1 hypothetical protein [Aliivibrio fischeri]